MNRFHCKVSFLCTLFLLIISSQLLKANESSLTPQSPAFNKCQSQSFKNCCGNGCGNGCGDCRGPAGPRGPRGFRGPRGPRGPIGGSTPFIVSRVVYVSKAGNDATGDGSQSAPFFTISQAMFEITDASVVKRYEINIGPGTYTEPTLHVKANVQLVGASPLLTIINSDVDINDPSWTGSVLDDFRSGFVDLTFLRGMNFDFALVDSFGGKLFFENITTNNIFVPVFTAISTNVNEVHIRNSLLANGYTQNGINMEMFSSFVSGGNITVNTHTASNTQVLLVGGGIAVTNSAPASGNIIINSFPGDGPIDTFKLLNFSISGDNAAIGGNIIVNNTGPALVIDATVDSLPIQSKITLTGLTTIRRLNDAFGLAYTPDTPANWVGLPPTTVQEALDRIAAFIGPVP